MAKAKPAPRKRTRDANTPSEEEFDDSDALDDSDTEKKQKKRKRASPTKKKPAPRKKRKTDSDGEAELELEDGQEIVGVVVQAPKTGRVPPGQISQNTFDFLLQLKDPKCNDREWFKLHDPVYRQAEQEWKDFVEVFTELLVEADDQIPPLPPKDVIHRIYRDASLANSMAYLTPLLRRDSPTIRHHTKRVSQPAFRGVGEKASSHFVGHIILNIFFSMIKPGNQSIIAAGTWCPAKSELDTLRANIKRDSSRLRGIISGATFVKRFGKAEAGARRNIFGREDELKVAPKGVEKTHPDIDLLKCRSFAVSHEFTDAQVLAPDFKQTVVDSVRLCMPFVHCLNDMMTTVPEEEDE
ncbi:hypothetical protein MIND_01177400 [Mycena indigotica]|uniref:Uncharacterized protein n=1 Tax=Mycena indigotica TaxID=2126181 RepID=A0A8H6VSW8_9AGAR|nr:uncharacterized protein MIND_01177400 [Mycena indigotica]KAF7292787.1 hypothetical protein MIND_01177400 [Mycena indigotica]